MEYSLEFVPLRERKKEEKRAKTAPLLFWDLYMMEYYRQKAIAKDLRLFHQLSTQGQWQYEWDIENIIREQMKTIVITDGQQSMVFASSNIHDMTGYFVHEVIGKTPRLFQGPGTTPESRSIIRQAIENQQSFQAILVNYKKDGTPYHCQIDGYPLYTRNNELTHFIAFEHEYHAKA